MQQEDLLDRVRKLLAKAETTTPQEAEALTAKAAELMARYGINQALIDAARPQAGRHVPQDKKISLSNPDASVKSNLLYHMATQMRCRAVIIARPDLAPGTAVHLFGYPSDLSRTEMLFTSILVQMARAQASATIPSTARSRRGWLRSWTVGYCAAVIDLVKAAEKAAVSTTPSPSSGPSAALVLADRSATVSRQVALVYPHLRKIPLRHSGTGYSQGYIQGQQADIGSSRIPRSSAPSLPH